MGFSPWLFGLKEGAQSAQTTLNISTNLGCRGHLKQISPIPTGSCSYLWHTCEPLKWIRWDLNSCLSGGWLWKTLPYCYGSLLMPDSGSLYPMGSGKGSSWFRWCATYDKMHCNEFDKKLRRSGRKSTRLKFNFPVLSIGSLIEDVDEDINQEANDKYNSSQLFSKFNPIIRLGIKTEVGEIFSWNRGINRL